MRAIDKKLLRDLWQMRGQLIAIALVIACGIASFVSMLSAYESLKLSQTHYYEQYRFAQVFTQLKRAPESLKPQIDAIPGVAQVQTRVVVDVSLDIPGRSEPAMGRLISIPERQMPMLNDLFIRRGRYIQPGRDDEVLISENFAQAHRLNLGDPIGAVINGRWHLCKRWFLCLLLKRCVPNHPLAFALPSSNGWDFSICSHQWVG
jgi:putative ABC transport system permease protein